MKPPIIEGSILEVISSLELVFWLPIFSRCFTNSGTSIAVVSLPINICFLSLYRSIYDHVMNCKNFSLLPLSTSKRKRFISSVTSLPPAASTSKFNFSCFVTTGLSIVLLKSGTLAKCLASVYTSSYILSSLPQSIAKSNKALA